jgi:D-glucosaminate-6-phosphate ammonia-lyase
MATLATSIYEELGVTPVINARGNNTVLGGSTPSPRVRQAMADAERYYVEMKDLLQRAGERIAELLECEAAYVTPGAAAAMAVGTAACITGNDVEKMARLPHTNGMKNKVLLQTRHHYPYEHVVTIVGTTLVDVGDERGTTREQLEAALDADVATVLYPAHLESEPGVLGLDEVLRIAHARGVPVLVDAAGRVYPLDLFKSYTRRGADLVAFGAKYIGAPNSVGILAGKKGLIEAAVPQGFVGFETTGERQTFGRPFKLDRQEVVAVVVALQEWMSMDHESRLITLERRLRVISDRLEGAPGVSTQLLMGDGPHVRVLELSLQPSARFDPRGLAQALQEESPAIAVRLEQGNVHLNPATLSDGDEEIVAERLARLLR